MNKFMAAAAACTIALGLSTPVAAQENTCLAETQQVLEAAVPGVTPEFIATFLQAPERNGAAPLEAAEATIVPAQINNVSEACRSTFAANVVAYARLGELPAAEPRFVASPVVQEVPVESTEETPVEAEAPALAEAEETEDRYEELRADVAALQREIANYQAQPADERAPETDARIPGMLERLMAAEALLDQLPKNEAGNIDLSSLTPAQQAEAEAVVEQAGAEIEQVETFVESYIDRGLLDIASVLGALAFLGFIFLVFSNRRRKKEIAAINQDLDDGIEVDTSGLATKEDIENLQLQVTQTAEKLESVADQSGHLDIHFAEGDEAALAQLDADTECQVTVMVNGEEQFKLPILRRDEQFFINVPNDKLVGHDTKVAVTPLKFVRRNYSKGMFDRLRLRSVADAA